MLLYLVVILAAKRNSEEDCFKAMSALKRVVFSVRKLTVPKLFMQQTKYPNPIQFVTNCNIGKIKALPQRIIDIFKELLITGRLYLKRIKMLNGALSDSIMGLTLARPNVANKKKAHNLQHKVHGKSQ